MKNLNLGDKVKELRLKKNLTLQDVADKIGSSKSYVWEIENHKNTNPTTEKLSKIANVLGTSVEYLIDKTDTYNSDMTIIESRNNSGEDIAFYRNYQKLKEDDKDRIKKIVESWQDE